MSEHTIALFGEAEKGKYRTAYYCRSMAELAEHFGEPPSEEAKGLHFAIQALLYNRGVIFFRVHEEGFSSQDYLQGLNLLEKKDQIPRLSALCLPGVGSGEIIEATTPIISIHQSFLIFSESDLYDYLTCRSN